MILSFLFLCNHSQSQFFFQLDFVKLGYTIFMVFKVILKYKMASPRLFMFSASRLLPMLRKAAHHTSSGALGGAQGSRGLSWTRYSALRSKWRALSTTDVVKEEEGIQDEGLQLSDSCVKVWNIHSRVPPHTQNAWHLGYQFERHFAVDWSAAGGVWR